MKHIAEREKSEPALYVFHRMQRSKVKPDEKTYHHLIQACSLEGHDLTLKLFEEFRSNQRAGILFFSELSAAKKLSHL